MNEKLDEKLALDVNIKEIIRDGVLKFGKVSSLFLMRKIKCDEKTAQHIIQAYESKPFKQDFYPLSMAFTKAP